MQAEVGEISAVEAAIAQAIRDAGFDPEAVKADVAALAAKLTGMQDAREKCPAFSYGELVRLAGAVPNFQRIKDGGALVVIGTVNIDGKHYRAHKSWATVDGEPIWRHPEVRELRTWRGHAIQELGHEYVPGSESLKRYVSVFWVPAGKKVAITDCKHDLFKGRRSIFTSVHET